MKNKQWVNGNHMLFESEHKTFNKQVDNISTGNVLGRVQFSGYIRPFTQTGCNGQDMPLGHLQDYDLNNIVKYFPFHIKEFIRKRSIIESVIAYEFRYFKNGKKIVCGYVLTDSNHKLIKPWVMGTYKCQSVIQEAIKYITD